MKTSNKKISRKHLRHLNKKERKQPLIVLKDLYEDKTDFQDFRTQVELLLLGGIDGRLRRNGFEYQLVGNRLKKQIEVAYILYIEADIKNNANYSPHIDNIKEMYSILKRGTIYNISEALFLFFGYQSLKGWRNEIDDLVSNASLGLKNYHHRMNDDALILYNYTMALVNSLHQIYQEEGLILELELPVYIKPVNTNRAE
ncbi:hypothetical protein FAZ15_08605 [Sphingobacterium olei]|uniref:Uncharacterized protein n=1 Tax=Sphingobacterium olei TaxID=2571155 RepID=A0A4U0P211_9SPHI|nr:hypothetical protein [Sphingobacterium olei]TJZ61249.1 hypothetical protein FAZ15_08605 [Sphingobacterium olei]